MNQTDQQTVTIAVRQLITASEFYHWRRRAEGIDTPIPEDAQRSLDRFGHWTISRVDLPTDLALLFKLQYNT